MVESPFDFGRIAATNALSDIYAMGGEALFALNIVGFPMKKLPIDVLQQILRGGAEIAEEARIPILGGHSTDFDVPVYGMAVTGRAPASRIRRNFGARPGDALVLTKPVGTGILTSALRARALKGQSLLKLGSRVPIVTPEEEKESVRFMTRLNRSAARAADELPVSACTDVTGYGLLGHLSEILRGSGVAGEISLKAVPLLSGARRLAEEGSVPEGTERNLAGVRDALHAESGITETDLLLLADAQTSGGLLFALPEPAAAKLMLRARESGDERSAVIGRIVPGDAGRMTVTS